MNDPNDGFPRSLAMNTEEKKEQRGALAGPESAAEHVRNALQLLGGANGVSEMVQNLGDDESLNLSPNGVQELRRILSAARARLVAALAILENKQ